MPKIDLTPTPAGVEEFARTAQAMSGRAYFQQGNGKPGQSRPARPAQF
jgi:hypothetical protein